MFSVVVGVTNLDGIFDPTWSQSYSKSTASRQLWTKIWLDLAKSNQTWDFKSTSESRKQPKSKGRALILGFHWFLCLCSHAVIGSNIELPMSYHDVVMPIGLHCTITSCIAVHWFISANWYWNLWISNENQTFDDLIKKYRVDFGWNHFPIWHSTAGRLRQRKTIKLDLVSKSTPVDFGVDSHV